MKAKWLPILIMALLLPSVTACYRHYGYRYYPNASYYAPRGPARVDHLRREPRREHYREHGRGRAGHHRRTQVPGWRGL